MRVALLAVIVVGGGAVLAGCASDAGPGAVPTGPDTYTMTEKFAPVAFDAEDAERDTVPRANQFCAEKGRQFAQVTKNLSGNPANPYGPNEFTLTFKCLLPSDPALAAYPVQQPNQQPAPAR
jgi:putative hemolysin